jgi:hypothetical protein
VTLEATYTTDFAALGFQIETSSIGCRLKSEYVDASFVHCPLFQMHSDEDRHAFLDYWDDREAPSELLLASLRKDGPRAAAPKAASARPPDLSGNDDQPNDGPASEP